MRLFLLTLTFLLSVFSVHYVDACNDLKNQADQAETDYNSAQQTADDLYVKFKKKELAFYFGDSNDPNQGKEMYELQERVVAARKDAQKKYDDWQEKKKQFEQCEANHDQCINCNDYISKGNPYQHRVFCSNYLSAAHSSMYPTGRYWSCNSSEVATHQERTCTRTSYSSSLQCGQTYQNCSPRVCSKQSSYGGTLYCSESAY